MKTHFFFWLVSLCCFVSVSHSCRSKSESERKAPNFVFILADDLGKIKIACENNDSFSKFYVIIQ
jgi:hypothetical protein